ncbi:uncharacterized protein LOC136087868 [Hydra vulgaris]|uniref:Uncharacterized protein LOC136087868 n=1 Tax=Hydra vulgaris TaxID=6087 RepID=A0ABM4D008_HYDVU
MQMEKILQKKTTKYKKDAVLNLCDTDISISHDDFLNLGPNFVPPLKSISYMDIITTTESSALKLEYNNKVENAQNLRKNVLRILKTEKKINNNLTKEQRISFREIKNDETIAIYPFDKETGFVRIEHSKVLEKIREQIGPTKIISEDSTARIRKNIYPSDPIPPRMYGVIKAHKPEKSYPMRIIISTIVTPNHGISEFLVKTIQPVLNENPTRLKNSFDFIKKAENWNVANNDIQVSYDVQLIELCLYQCYFHCNNEIHVMENSGPIGLSFMVVLAESFLQFHENNAIKMALTKNPALMAYYKYTAGFVGFYGKN